MVKKNTFECICEVGDSRDLLIDSGGLCSKDQTKTMTSQPREKTPLPHVSLNTCVVPLA